MKKLLVTLLSATALAILIPASTFAASAKTDITGTVTNNGKPIAGAQVTVVCDNKSRKDTTNSSGDYLVQYPAKQCPDKTKATVVATKDGLGGVNSGSITGLTTKLNVAIINVSLPEFGLITGVGATVAGAGAFMYTRKRQLRS